MYVCMYSTSNLILTKTESTRYSLLYRAIKFIQYLPRCTLSRRRWRQQQPSSRSDAAHYRFLINDATAVRLTNLEPMRWRALREAYVVMVFTPSSCRRRSHITKTGSAWSLSEIIFSIIKSSRPKYIVAKKNTTPTDLQYNACSSAGGRGRGRGHTLQSKIRISARKFTISERPRWRRWRYSGIRSASAATRIMAHVLKGRSIYWWS